MSLRSLALAAAAIVVAAPAWAAYTTGSVNIRTGPSTGYPVITTAAPGARVGVHDCVPGWCRVNYGGVQGWMSALYIAGNGPQFIAPQPYIIEEPPPFMVYPGYRQFRGGSYFSFSFGTGFPHHHHHRW